MSENLHITGGKPLSGTIVPSGNKNAVLPILCATVLTDEECTIRNIPDITDIRKLVAFFKAIGSYCEWDQQEKTIVVRHDGLGDGEINNLPEGMRSSVMLFGPLLSRVGRVCVKHDTTGCSLGAREVDPHLEVLAGFGVDVDWSSERLLTMDKKFQPFHHWMDYASVTTTEHFLMCAAATPGRSTLMNAASEPHVQDLCKALVAMGAKIDGIGTSVLTVEGVDKLSGCDVTVSDDYHEVLTFLGIGAITGGEVRVEHNQHEHFPLMFRTFSKFGIEVLNDDKGSYVQAGSQLKIQEPLSDHLLPKVEGAPWPYFPVDLLPIVMALGAVAEGETLFWNKVYEGAMGWLPELQKFGARLTVCDPHRVIISGRQDLRPAAVEAPYIIRVIISLFMVASTIDGKSVIHKADPVRRAHPNFVENLQALGADAFWADAD